LISRFFTNVILYALHRGSNDGFDPYGAKSIGESGKVRSVGAVANAIYNALGHRMKDLPITRDRILGVFA